MPADIQWNRQLIKRYGHTAATCSGYASNSQLRPGFFALDLLRELRKSHLPLQLAVSLLPEQSTSIDSYLECLEREIDLLSCHLAPGQSVQRLHLGAGAMDAAQLQRLLDYLHKRFSFQPGPLTDYSVEINPAQADWASMGVLRELGFNHVSIGVPDACPAAAGVTVDFRDPRKTSWLIEAARALHFASVNIDLGYGRAWQSLASFSGKLAAIVEQQPNRILLFDYAHPPQRYRVTKRFRSRGLASVSNKLVMYQHAVELLGDAGYCYIGLGQFALADDPLVSAREDAILRYSRLGYSCQPEANLLGLGMGAVSQIGALQLQNRRDAASYQAQLELGQLAVFHGHRCSAQEQMQRALSDALLCNFQVDLQALERRFGALLRDYLAVRKPVLEQMADDGLLALSAGSLTILPAGRLLVGAVCKVMEQGRAEPETVRRRVHNLSVLS